MGTSVEMIDRTYGQLAPDAEEYERGLLDAYDAKTEAFGQLSSREGGEYCVQVPAKALLIGEADARTRTEDPFITRERRVRDARPRAGTRGHVLAGVRPFERVGGGTRVPARARADVPVLYPVEADV